MTDQLISIETAKLAKEKGFHEETQAMTVGENYPIVSNPQEESPYDWNGRKGYSIPTQSLLQKWLREKHNIDILIKPWTGDIKGSKTYAADVTIFGSTRYVKCLRLNTYEEALEQGLRQGLLLIK